jgi:kinesin family protein 6/9
VSTCRFAQRVARVRNDARLNEEVDPAVIIRQLKAQVASLQEELVIARGDVKEGDELKDYERDKLRARCVEYVKDPEPGAHLNMGEFTYTKMRECFAILRSLVVGGGGSGGGGGGGDEAKTTTAVGAPVRVIGGGNQELEQRIAELERLVQQRDNEIAIMVNMIRTAKGELPESLTNRQSVAVLPSPAPGGQSVGHKGPKALPPPQPASFSETFQVDPAILDDPTKAFEAFKTHYPKNDVIRDNKVALKQKYDAAKELANSVNDARNQIKALTLQMDKLRKQQAIADEGLLDNSSAGGSESNPEAQEAELRLKEQIDHYKAVYKKGFAELSELKKEIQHIQKMLEMGRLRLQKEFDLWYQRQGKGALLTEALVAQPKESSSAATPTPTTTVSTADRSTSGRSSSRGPPAVAGAGSKHVLSPRDPATLPSKSGSPGRPPSARSSSVLKSDGSSSSLLAPSASDDARKARSVRSSTSSSVATMSSTPRSSIARYATIGSFELEHLSNAALSVSTAPFLPPAQ